VKTSKYLGDLTANKNLHFSIALLVLIVITLWVINAFGISYPIDVTTKQASGELAVIGEGKVDVVPDTATVNVGIVVSNASTTEEAQSQINETNNAIVAAMQSLGIPDEDISTSNYSINPDYNYDSGRNEITGYSGNASLTIKVKNLDTLPQVIEQSTANGANQILGTSFIVDKPEEAREKARNAAIENAQEQAKELADRLGIRLGKVTNIVEASTDVNYPIPMYDRALSVEGMGGGSANLQPGSQTITSTVTLYFDKR